MNFFLRLIIIIGVLLLILAITLVSMALVLGFSLGVGWLLTLFLPFDLFQTTLLALISAVVAVAFWRNFLSSLLPFGADEDDFYEDEDDDYDDYDRIPESRFYKKNTDKTWEAWLRSHLANSIYFEFQDSPQPVTPMGKKQQQELAIRLADLVITFLKAKKPGTRRLNITMSTLKQQMNKIGQKPYDDDILRLAILAANEELNYHYEDIVTVMRSKLWNELYDQYF
ncbi:MAG: hypothetical protein JW953_15775 [Anaerolineae bacterium]|nr:hypothetical protein [Anaerolineae bacterium]